VFGSSLFRRSADDGQPTACRALVLGEHERGAETARAPPGDERPVLAACDHSSVADQARNARIVPLLIEEPERRIEVAEAWADGDGGGGANASEREDDSLTATLLRDIYTVFENGAGDRLRTADLIAHLAEIEESPWGDWHGKPITPHGLSRLLRSHRIKTMPVKVDGETVRGYKVEQFADAFARVLSVTGVTNVTSGSPGQAGGNASSASNAYHTNGRNPCFGDEGYLGFIAAAHRAGHITTEEAPSARPRADAQARLGGAGTVSEPISFPIPEELVEVIAERAAEMVVEELGNGSPWLTREAAARYLSLPVSRLEKDKQIPCHREGRRVLYHRDELDAYLRA
jgi:Protein of unknown function (DUF3631)